MPGDYHIDGKLGIVFVRAWGTYTDEEMLDLQRRIHADPAFDPEYDKLVDLSQIDHLPVTTQGTRTLTALSRWGAGSRRAVIAPDDHTFAMSRMNQNLREAQEQPAAAVFRTKGEALSWLGIEEVEPSILPSGQHS